MDIFLNCQFEYDMNGRPNGLQYQMLKDLISWKGLSPKHYISLFNAMLRNFIKHLPKK